MRKKTKTYPLKNSPPKFTYSTFKHIFFARRRDYIGRYLFFVCFFLSADTPLTNGCTVPLEKTRLSI